MQNGSSVGTRARCMQRFRTFWRRLACSVGWLVNKISESDLGRKFIKSALLAGYQDGVSFLPAHWKEAEEREREKKNCLVIHSHQVSLSLSLSPFHHHLHLSFGKILSTAARQTEEANSVPFFPDLPFKLFFFTHTHWTSAYMCVCLVRTLSYFRPLLKTFHPDQTLCHWKVSQRVLLKLSSLFARFSCMLKSALWLSHVFDFNIYMPQCCYVTMYMLECPVGGALAITHTKKSCLCSHTLCDLSFPSPASITTPWNPPSSWSEYVAQVLSLSLSLFRQNGELNPFSPPPLTTTTCLGMKEEEGGGGAFSEGGGCRKKRRWEGKVVIPTQIKRTANGVSSPNQQRTLHKLPPELRRRNFVSKHRLSIQKRCQMRKKCVRNVYIFRLSSHFARHRWWLGSGTVSMVFSGAVWRGFSFMPSN